jgi:hypothetical protein
MREGLEAFLSNQRFTGQFPVKIHSTNIVDRYLHSFLKREQPNQTPIKPKYITAHNTISLDGNALLVIAALNYAGSTGPVSNRPSFGWRSMPWNLTGCSIRPRLPTGPTASPGGGGCCTPT